MQDTTQTIVILNGPNLNLLGIRNTDIYGAQSFEEYLLKLQEELPQVHFIYHQSNHEGILIDLLHQYGFDGCQGIILNAGGYTHTSIALADAVDAITTPVIEVHISDIKKRESFRHHSYLEEVCFNSIIGQGLNGYKEAVDMIIINLR